MPNANIPTPTMNMFMLVVNIPAHVTPNPHAIPVNTKFSFFIYYTIQFICRWVKHYCENNHQYVFHQVENTSHHQFLTLHYVLNHIMLL